MTIFFASRGAALVDGLDHLERQAHGRHPPWACRVLARPDQLVSKIDLRPGLSLAIVVSAQAGPEVVFRPGLARAAQEGLGLPFPCVRGAGRAQSLDAPATVA